MSLITIDVSSPEDLFKAPEFKLLPKGKHLFEVANELVVEKAKSSDNQVIQVEAVCQDEDENKGTHVWDCFVIITNPTSDKQRKAKSINQARLCQFAVACGVRTKEQIENGEGIPLDEFKGVQFEAITKIISQKDPNDLDSEGNPIEKQRAKISRYLFEDDSESSE